MWILTIWVMFNGHMQIKELKIYDDYSICQRAAQKVELNMKHIEGFSRALCVPSKKRDAEIKDEWLFVLK
jgi:hypothetical protein